MSRFFLGNQAVEVSQSPQLDGYSKVIINIDDENSITVGNDLGRTLELDCPWGTQQMAQQILAGLSGYSYKPYEADGTLLDPAAELGDSISVHGVYGGVYTRNITFDDIHSTDISAPVNEEVEHEYEYHPQQEQKVKRQFEEMESQLTFQAGEIAAKVSKTGGSSSSFGWTLTESGFILSSGSKEVFRADANGITVTGNIQATSGFIGNANNGFTISNRAIYNGTSSMSSTANGVYIGTDGINLGGGKFKVDSSGNLTASSGTFSGNVYASNIQYGGSYGTFNGAGISGGSIGTGQIRDKAITKEKLAEGISQWIVSQNIDIDATKAFVQEVASKKDSWDQCVTDIAALKKQVNNAVNTANEALDNVPSSQQKDHWNSAYAKVKDLSLLNRLVSTPSSSITLHYLGKS